MSTFSVPIVKFSLEKHTNSDNLSLAKIKGWVCCVKTSEFENETLGIYLPLDSIADKDHPFLAFLEGKKVKARKLRGVYSEGVLLPLAPIKRFYDHENMKTGGVPYPEFVWQEGYDVKDILNIKKWEPPIPNQGNATSVKGGGCETIQRPSWLSKFTDIESYKNWTDVLQEGEEVSVSLKIHGSSAVFSLIDGEFYICSMNRCLRTKEKEIEVPYFENKHIRKVLKIFNLHNYFTKKKILPVPNSIWHRAFNQLGIKAYLTRIANATDCNKVAIYGEVIPSQDLLYGLKPGEVDFYAFDIKLGMDIIQNKQTRESKWYNNENNEGYVSPEFFKEICTIVCLKYAPTLYEGPFNQEVLKLANGKDPIGKTHVREGIVIRPITPRYENKLGRVILKVVGSDFLLRKEAKDETELTVE